MIDRVRPALFLALLLSTYASPGLAQDELFWDGFWYTSAAARPTALGIYGGEIIAGGVQSFGGIPVGPVARFDGTRWHAIPTPGADVFTPRAFANYDGDLVAGGEITLSHSSPENILLWTGSAWRSLKAGVDGQVLALLPLGADLIVGGEFSNSANNALDHAARWDGSKWYGLGNGFNGAVQGLVEFEGDIIAVGDFTASGDGATPLNHVARWNGAQWVDMGSGLSGSTISVLDVVVLGETLYVSGEFAAVGGTNLAAWDGSAWSGVGWNSGPVKDMAVYQGQLYATGYTTNIWNGSTWTAFAQAPQASPMLATPDTLVIGHAFGPNYGGGNWWSQHILTWDGTEFSGLISNTVNSPSHKITCLLPYAGTLVVGGSFFWIGDQRTDQLARWDGTNWYPTDLGLPEAMHMQCLTEHEGEIVAGGTIFGIIRSTGGHAPWVQMSAGFFPYALTSYHGVLYAGGNGQFKSWDGSTWTTAGGGITGNIADMLIFGDELVVAGTVSNAGGLPVNMIATWDGTSWSTYDPGLDLPSGCRYQIHSLAEYEGDLVVSGEYYLDCLVPRSFYSRWDGTAWSSIPTPFDPYYDPAYAMLEYDGKLVMAGKYDRQSDGLAMWDGTAWTHLGTGLNFDAYALAEFQGSLMIGGGFTRVGSVPSPHIAQWNRQTTVGLPDVDPAPVLARLHAFPNPLRSRIRIAYELPASSFVTLTVHDVQGRLVHELLRGPGTPGPHELVWYGAGPSGRRLPAGLYFLRLSTPARTDVQKVVIAP
jgi:hypothetical protein